MFSPTEPPARSRAFPQWTSPDLRFLPTGVANKSCQVLRSEDHGAADTEAAPQVPPIFSIGEKDSLTPTRTTAKRPFAGEDTMFGAEKNEALSSFGWGGAVGSLETTGVAEGGCSSQVLVVRSKQPLEVTSIRGNQQETHPPTGGATPHHRQKHKEPHPRGISHTLAPAVHGDHL